MKTTPEGKFLTFLFVLLALAGLANIGCVRMRAEKSPEKPQELARDLVELYNKVFEPRILDSPPPIPDAGISMVVAEFVGPRQPRTCREVVPVIVPPGYVAPPDRRVRVRALFTCGDELTWILASQ